MSAQDTTESDSTESDDAAKTAVHPSVVSVMREATDSQQEAIDRLITAAEKNGVNQTVTAEKLDYGPVTVKIQPDETWWNEGEGGFDSLYVAITKYKGVHHGNESSPTARQSLDDKTFSEVESRVRLMY
jgi:hypothetical protein